MSTLKFILGTSENLIGCGIVKIYLEMHLGIFFGLRMCRECLGFPIMVYTTWRYRFGHQAPTQGNWLCVAV